MAKIPDSDLPRIIDRYRNLELLADIATEYHCTPQALYDRIRLYCDTGKGDAQYHELVTDVYVLRHMRNEDLLEQAPDQLELARARELARCSQWKLERRLNKLYGQKQEVTTDNTIRVIIDDRSPLVIPHIDVQPVQIPSNSEVIDNQEEE